MTASKERSFVVEDGATALHSYKTFAEFAPVIAEPEPELAAWPRIQPLAPQVLALTNPRAM